MVAKLHNLFCMANAAVRAIVLRVKRDGLSHADIAAELDISVKTVENLLASAKKRLRGQSKDILYCLAFF